MRAIVKHDEVCRRFMTIPGVGPLTAMLFKSAVDDPHRFSKSAHVGVHLGLTPRKYASGEVDYNGRITKCGDPMTSVASIRGGAGAYAAFYEKERPENMGRADCQARVDEKGLCGCGEKTGGDHAPHVG